MALERRRERREAFGEIETEHPGYLGSQDTYHVGNIKDVGRIYQQTFLDTYTRVAFAKLYETKHAITSPDLLNDRVLPFFEEQQIPLLGILTDLGTEYKGKPEHHKYELYLNIEGIDHSKTQVRGIRKATESAKGCTGPSRKSFTLLPFTRNSTTAWLPYRSTWMSG